MNTIIRAPTADNSTRMVVNSTASAEQLLPPGKNVLAVSSTVPYFILFGLPGQIPAVTPATAFPLPAGTQLIVTSREATAFRVITGGTVTGRFGWLVL